MLSMLPAVALALVIGTPPKLEALVDATKKGDAVEIDRIARRLGVSRLDHALQDGSPEIRRAVLEAAPRVEGAWTMLPAICRWAATPDDGVGHAALRAARRIALSLDPGAAGTDEVPLDLPRLAQKLLLQSAQKSDLSPQRRAAALGVVTLLRAWGAPPRATLIELLADGAPEVRRAAIDALAADAGATDALGRLLIKETEPAVAAAIASAICVRLPRIQTGEWGRVRELALDRHVEPADAVDLLACLATGSAEDRARVTEAAHHHAQPVVRAAAERLAQLMASSPTATFRPASAPASPPARPASKH